MKRVNFSIQLIAIGAEIAAIIFLVAFFWNKLALYEEYKPLINSIESAKAETYTDDYQCLDFSKDLHEKLRKEGVESKVEIVKQENDSDKYHAVISLQIEPQNGTIVDYDSVDECFTNEGELICQKGLIKDKKIYITKETDK